MRFGDASLTDYYQQRIEVPFFNYYLLGKGDGGELAGATIFFTGENRCAPSKSGLRPTPVRRFFIFGQTAG
ncbi:MAG: hypothetical protein ACLR76_12055 [Alistipes sp.]